MIQLLKKIVKKVPLLGITLIWFKKILYRYLEPWIGPKYAIDQHENDTNNTISLEIGLETIQKRWPLEEDCNNNQPIFILSAGWRSGSTLLQRLVMSGDSILIWGEPYGHANIIQELSNPLSKFTKQWPPDEFFIDYFDKSKLKENWVANLYPSVHALRNAHRAFFDTLFRHPAEDLGFKRWGMKEVRLDVQDAKYLHWLYPNAKFLFIIRNPFDAYRSYRLFRNWYSRWPDMPMFTPKQFALHWRQLAEGYINDYKAVNGILLKYEDVVYGKSRLRELEQYLGFEIDYSVLATKIKSNKNTINNTKLEEVPNMEVKIIEKIVYEISEKLGYTYQA